MCPNVGMPDTRGPYPSRVPSLWAGGPGVVEEMVMIARMWRGCVRTKQANAYVAYITGTGLREYAATQATSAARCGRETWEMVEPRS
jgi:hypothetical protein